MQTDTIRAVGIDEQGALWVEPTTTRFPYVYREAMGVRWSAKEVRLFGAKPREFPDLDFTKVQWFRQIVAAAQEQGVELLIAETTDWSNIEPDLREEIAAAGAKAL
jgi:hypothetical protein